VARLYQLTPPSRLGREHNEPGYLRRSRVKLILTIFISLLLGCGGGSGTSSPTPTQTPSTPVLAVPAAPVLTMISLSPATASIHVGGGQTYIAQGLDQYNNPMTGIVFTWASSDDGGNGSAIAMFHGGVATGTSPGTMHVTASAAGVTSAPAALTVLGIGDLPQPRPRKRNPANDNSR
jgi:hypothetical protein